MKKTLLIIEDDIDIQNYYELILSDLDLEFIKASDGIEAISIIDSGKNIDLIILDVLMPNMDGEEFLWKLRSGRKVETPVLVSTIDSSLAENLKSIGKIHGVFIKGNNGERLKKLVKRLIK